MCTKTFRKIETGCSRPSTTNLMSKLLASLLRGRALLLPDERLVDVRDHTTTSDSGLDQSVQLLVSPDGELEMSGRDPLHLEILTGVAGQLEDLGGEVLQDGGAVHGGSGAHPAAAEGAGLEVTVDPKNISIKSSLTELILTCQQGTAAQLWRS